MFDETACRMSKSYINLCGNCPIICDLFVLVDAKLEYYENFHLPSGNLSEEDITEIMAPKISTWKTLCYNISMGSNVQILLQMIVCNKYWSIPSIESTRTNIGLTPYGGNSFTGGYIHQNPDNLKEVLCIAKNNVKLYGVPEDVLNKLYG